MRNNLLIKLVVLTIYVVLLSSCSKNSDSRFSKMPVISQQYFVQGMKLYTEHCSNCHQKDGSGLGLLYPPLNKSDFMEKNFDQVICLMKYGKSGKLIVNGKEFNKEMPGIPSLTDIEVTEIATFIYNSWEHQRDSIETSNVRQILFDCADEK